MMSERARLERALEQDLNSALARAESAYRTALQEGDARLERERREASGRLRAMLEDLRDDAERDGAEATRAMEEEVSSFAARTDSLEQSAREELEESAWLAETMVESAQRKMEHEFSLVSRAVSAGQAELEGARERARAMLARHGHAPMPEATGSAGEVPPEGLASRYEKLGREAGEALWSLGEAVDPVATRVTTLVAGVLVAGIGGALGGAALRPASMPLNIGLATGAGLCGSLVVLVYLVLRLVLRRRVPSRARRLAGTLADASAAGQEWQAWARGERDRQASAVRQRREGEIRKAKERYTTIRAEVQQRRRVEGPALKARHEAQIARVRREQEAREEELRREGERREEEWEASRREVLARAGEERARSVREAEAAHRRGREELARSWNAGIDAANQEYAALVEMSGRACPDWDDPCWDSVRASEGVPEIVRIGSVGVDLDQAPGGLGTDASLARPSSRVLELPVVLEPGGVGSLLVSHGAEGRGAALALLQDALLRILTSFPAGKAKFTIIDPVGLGQSFAGLMHLADYEEGLVGDKIWTDARRIEQKLADLTDHMENVIQKYLRNEFASIQEYNAQAGEVAEPFRFLVIADFPAGMSEAAGKRLAAIAQSGPRCGVFTLIAHDARQRAPQYIPMADLERSSVRILPRQGRMVLADESLGAWPLRMEQPPAEEQFTRLVHAVGRLAKDSGKVRVPFELVAPSADKRWSLDASEELRVPIGRAGATRLQHLTLGRGTQQHALVAGRTGAGKSTLLHALITNVSLWYSPREVELYLVDFKKGVEFKTYAAHGVPHARVVALESEREFGLSVLRKLDAELTRRGELFREPGVQDLSAYRRWARGAGAGRGEHLARTLLIVDEFQEFFISDDTLAQEAGLLLDRLVRQGRAFGVHVVMGSQTIGGAYSIARSTIGQMAVRIALQCSESDSYLILSEDNPAARLLSRPGEAIYNDQSGLVEGNSPFQIAWLPDDKRDQALGVVEDLARRSGSARAGGTIVFEGNAPAELSRLELVRTLLAGGEGAGVRPGRAPRAFLGEPISIKEPTSATLRRQSGANIAVVGQQERPATGLMVSSLATLAAHHALSGEGCRFFVLDAGDAENDQTPLLARAAGALGPACSYGGVRDADAIVAEVSRELERRRGDPHSESPRWYLLVHGLHRFRNLRRSESDFLSPEEDASTTDRKFARILREGAGLGIHVVAWCDNAGNLERAVDRRGVREFDSRVLFQMSGSDSSALIDGGAAAHLGQHRALLYTEELGESEKFRPFAPPDPGLLDEVLRACVARWATRGA